MIQAIGEGETVRTKQQCCYSGYPHKAVKAYLRRVHY